MYAALRMGIHGEKTKPTITNIGENFGLARTGENSDFD